MAAPVCIRCAKPAGRYRPLAFGKDGALVHDFSQELPCVLMGEAACEHPGIDCADLDPCRSPAEGYGICAWCERAALVSEMVHAEQHFVMVEPGRPFFDSQADLVPFSTVRPFYVRARRMRDLDRDAFPVNAAGVTVEARPDGSPVLVCASCAKAPWANGFDWLPFAGWNQEDKVRRSLTAQQARVLDYVSAADHPVGATEAADALGMVKSNASRLLARLAELALLTPGANGRYSSSSKNNKNDENNENR